MRQYAVYEHDLKGLKAVKVGFSWPALYFGIFWALAKRLWVPAIALIVCVVVLYSLKRVVVQMTAANTIDRDTFLIARHWVFTGAQLALWVAPGFLGNTWLRKDLERRGYRRIRTVDAEDRIGAISGASLSEREANALRVTNRKTCGECRAVVRSDLEICPTCGRDFSTDETAVDARPEEERFQQWLSAQTPPRRIEDLTILEREELRKAFRWLSRGNQD